MPAKHQKAKEIDRLESLEDKGWTRVKDISANKVFLLIPMAIEGRLHATDKIFLLGMFVVTDRIECEGTLTLNGIEHTGAISRPESRIWLLWVGESSSKQPSTDSANYWPVVTWW
ncbi:hypothetical protein F4802DRAFT_549065 [Xylaria palmicola]|nr:hypothetical protein F4802DRAFT_549065 [Xylaria palmicola]